MAEPRTEDKGFRRRPIILDYLGMGRLDEPEAREYAEGLVRDAREHGGRLQEAEGSAPDPDEVRERREVRRLREARQEN